MDEEMVFLSMPITFHGKDTGIDAEGNETESEINITMPIDYTRLTTDGNVTYTVKVVGSDDKGEGFSLDGVVNEKGGDYELDLALAAEDETLFTLKGAYAAKDKETNFLLSLTFQGDASEYLLQCRQTTEDMAVDTLISVYIKDKTATLMALTETDSPLATLRINAEVKEDDGRFDHIKAATPETAAQVLTMSPEEQESFLGQVSSNGMELFQNIAPKLPASILALLFPQPGIE